MYTGKMRIKLNEMVDILDELHKYVPMVKTTEVYELRLICATFTDTNICTRYDVTYGTHICFRKYNLAVHSIHYVMA